MNNLTTVAVDDLHDTLESLSTGKAVKRLTVALAYNDVSVETLSERYDTSRSTEYYWLDRFEELPIEEAVRDDDRPGRPPDLTAEERDELHADLAKPPRTFGFDAASWSTETVRTHVAEKYGVEYSYGHIRRLLSASTIDSPYR